MCMPKAPKPTKVPERQASKMPERDARGREEEESRRRRGFVNLMSVGTSTLGAPNVASMSNTTGA